MKTGVELIAEERQRQEDEEGWTPEHDDQHTEYELAHAAACYLMRDDSDILKKYWPFGWPWWKPSHSRVRNLVKAGALVAAEIDRVQRRLEY